jgi:hypothetical protein
MRVDRILFATMSVMAVILGGCSSRTDSAMSLDEYAKRDCAISADLMGKLKTLQQEVTENLTYPSVMADKTASIADLYKDAAVKTEKLGDPPNGEGVGQTKAAAETLRSMAADLEQSASKLRSAMTEDQIAASIEDLMNAFGKAGPALAEFNARYQTPEVDALEKKIPGCTDETK